MFPCLSLRAFWSNPMCTVVDLCVLPCRPLCICLAELAHGQWTSKLHAAIAVFLMYCQGHKSSAYLVVTNHVFLVCVCSAGHPIFSIVITINELSRHK